MLVLAFDTATPAVTAALHDGERVLAEVTTIDARRHGELLIPSVREVLREAGAALADVTAIVAGSGPGPYTGLRVGLMTAQALATTTGVTAYGLCSLDVLAYASGLSESFLVATDARRKEVFWAEYADMRTRVSGPSVDRPADVPGGPPLVGAGARLHADVLGEARLVAGAPEYPSAGALAALAAERLTLTAGGHADQVSGPAPHDAVLTLPHPIYLRRPDAHVPGPPKKVTA
ncbi:tRNA (adenosine(37)-N6)-threonylcarbamoyltransferase complex dimerization subunit type 1 TsaB [Sphaerisporangium sp. NPDC051017]|uniref:tRNA (adenosine(37)-N6)-threonylcarbamoyltransferase complex dimerization subunit type 1 TsaB n=1 Tax=Sphaerisporangium sp. NPDC051017 TaxID=3154636 RepID=UPI003447C41C